MLNSYLMMMAVILLAPTAKAFCACQLLSRVMVLNSFLMMMALILLAPTAKAFCGCLLCVHKSHFEYFLLESSQGVFGDGTGVYYVQYKL